MNDATTITELPVLTTLPRDYTGREISYRGAIMDEYMNPSVHGTISHITSGESPDSLARNGNPYSAAYVNVWNEAHNENARRNASEFVAAEDRAPIVEEPTREVVLERQLQAANERIRELEQQQIKADDPRLSEFWDEAHTLANNAGHCSVYDNLVEALGGPRREKDYIMTLDVTMRVRVRSTGTDSDDAFENLDQESVDEAVREFTHNSDVSYELYDWDEA